MGLDGIRQGDFCSSSSSYHKTEFNVCLFRGRCLCVMLASLNVLGPIADVLVEVKYKIGGTRHVVLALSFAHVIVRAIQLVRVVADVTVLLSARHFVGCE